MATQIERIATLETKAETASTERDDLYKKYDNHHTILVQMETWHKWLKWLVFAVIGGALTMGFSLIATVVGHWLLVGVEKDRANLPAPSPIIMSHRNH